MKLLLTIVCIVTASVVAMAQNNNLDQPTKGDKPTTTTQSSTSNDTTVVDIIILKSGVVFRGTIISQIQNVLYTIKLADGTVLDLEARLVDQILKEKVVNGKVISNANQEVVYKATDNNKNKKQYLFMGGFYGEVSLPIIVLSNNYGTNLSYGLGIQTLGGYRLFDEVYVGATLSLGIGNGVFLSNSGSSTSFEGNTMNYGLNSIWKVASYNNSPVYQYVFFGQDFSTIQYEGLVLDQGTSVFKLGNVKESNHSLVGGTGILINVVKSLYLISETRLNYFWDVVNFQLRVGLVYSPNF